MRALIFTVLFAIPGLLHAAELRMHSSPAADGVRYEFSLDSEGVSVNAIEGSLLLDDVRDVRYGNSMVTLWHEAPAYADGTLRFSGITPGGFVGKNGFLFSIVAAEGEPRLIDGRAYLNDGAGTAIDLTLVAVTDGETPTDVADTILPQEFMPVVGSDPSIGSGTYFVSFFAQDKETGVVEYEVKESRFPLWLGNQRDGWNPAVSPYMLVDQSLRSFVQVRARDAAGNERTARLIPQHGMFSHGVLPTGLALCVGIAGILLLSTYARILWRRRRSFL